MSEHTRVRYWAFASFAICIGTVVGVLCAELTLRTLNGADFKVRDLRPVPWGIPSGGFTEYDERLGWVPRPYAKHTWPGGWSAAIDGDRLRSNGTDLDAYDAQVMPILAIGDSTAFGDEVEDDQSWPAALERRLRRQVKNAGVGGYGIDQIFLRSERRLQKEKFAVVVMSFVSDDITRCAYSFRNRWKPYFKLNDKQLTMIPPPSPDVALPESSFMVALGKSYLARAVLTRLFPSVWTRSTHRRVHDDEFDVASLLVVRLKALADARGSKLLLVALVGADGSKGHVPELLDAARLAGISTLDLTDQLSSWAITPESRGHFFRPKYHLSEEGNEWVAEQIEQELVRKGWLD